MKPSPSELGRLMGKLGGPARAKKLSAARRKEIASLGGQTAKVLREAKKKALAKLLAARKKMEKGGE